MTRYRRRLALAPVACLTVLGPTAVLSPASGQERSELFAGDSVRVNGTLVGSVLSIDGDAMTVLSREQPRCVAGLMHGEAAICDPAPLVRQTMDIDEVVIERRMAKGNEGRRTILGGLLGAAAFGGVGYLIGPSLGFGGVDGCAVNGQCAPGDRQYPEEEFAARQKASDQKRGAMFFGVFGGTITAVLVKRLSVGWVRIEPIVTVAGAAPLGLTFTVPASR